MSPSPREALAAALPADALEKLDAAGVAEYIEGTLDDDDIELDDLKGVVAPLLVDTEVATSDEEAERLCEALHKLLRGDAVEASAAPAPAAKLLSAPVSMFAMVEADEKRDAQEAQDRAKGAGQLQLGDEGAGELADRGGRERRGHGSALEDAAPRREEAQARGAPRESPCDAARRVHEGADARACRSALARRRRRLVGHPAEAGAHGRERPHAARGYRRYPRLRPQVWPRRA